MTTNDKLTTVYVGNIHVAEDVIRKVLDTFGPVKSWKRVKDPKGNYKSFGFATFQEPTSVIEILGGEATSVPPIEFPVNRHETKPLKLSLDSSAREYIEQLRSSANGVSEEEIEVTRTRIYDILAPFGISRPTVAQGEAESFLSSLAETKPTAVEERGPKSPVRERRSPSRDRRRAESNDRRSHRDSRRGYSRDDYDTEDEETKRKERLKTSQLKAYHDRLRRWEAREVARDRKIQHDLQKDADFDKNRAHVEQYLRDYDDGKEMEIGKDEYYRDRYVWYQRRQAFVRREREYDDRDRQLEGTDELSNMNEDQKDQDVVMTPAEEPDQNVGRIMTKEERESRIKDLIAKIPVEKKDLFAWSVRWDHLDETLLDKKLTPFISKKIVEYMGEEEPTLLKFIAGLLRQHKEPQTLVSELEGPLDEDAEVFVLKLWRMLIYETESKHEGLT